MINTYDKIRSFLVKNNMPFKEKKTPRANYITIWRSGNAYYMIMIRKTQNSRTSISCNYFDIEMYRKDGTGYFGKYSEKVSYKELMEYLVKK